MYISRYEAGCRLIDILTHAGVGLAGAGVLLPYDPLAALAFAFGSIMPDLDAVMRVFGAERYLRWHQTWSHALPTQLACGVLLLLTGYVAQNVTMAVSMAVLWPVVSAGTIAMMLHSLLDLCNTYGVAIAAPLSRRRYHLDVIFFIDATFALLLGPLAIWSTAAFLQLAQPPPLWCAIATILCLGGYILLRVRLRKYVVSSLAVLGYQVVAAVPSALSPLQYLVVLKARGETADAVICGTWDYARVMRLQTDPAMRYYDQELPAIVAELSPWQFMRSMSPAYHAVAKDINDQGETVFHCVDVRIRNFNTRFGSMVIRVDHKGVPHVDEFII